MKNADTSFMMLCEICHIKVQTYNHALIHCTILHSNTRFVIIIIIIRPHAHSVA